MTKSFRTGRVAIGSITAAAILALTTSVYAAGHVTPQEKKLIEGAKKEGSVTLINPLFSDRTSQRLNAAFKKHYGLPDSFKVNTLRKGTGSTVAQVRQEMKAGKYTVDLVLVHNPAFYDAAAERGLFLELDSGHWKDSADNVKKAGQYSRYPLVVTPLAYTFQPVWNSSCPGMKDFNVTSYADAVKASLKGKTISSDITKSFTYRNTVLALEENGIDVNKMWDELKKTDPIVEFRTEPKMQMIISCQRPFDMWNLSGRVYQNIKKKADLAKVLKMGSYKEGQVMLGNQIAVLKGAKHPNAAKLLVEFLLTKEGSDVFVEGEAIYSFRTNYTAPEATKPYLLELSKHKLIGMKDWGSAPKNYKRLNGEWQKRFR